MGEISISSLFGLIIGSSYLLLTGLIFGEAWLKQFKQPWRLILGIGLTICLLSITGSFFYYFYYLNTLTLLLSTIIIAALGLSLVSLKLITLPNPINHLKNLTKFNTLEGLLFVAGLLSLGVWWLTALKSPITEAIRSPWLSFSPFNLVTLFIASSISLYLINFKSNFKRKHFLGETLIILTLFTGLSLLSALYPMGFGFDPFLHRATVEHIAEFGTINPKPLYYIGQYIIELLGLKILHWPLFNLDVLLSPLLASTLIPAALFAYNQSHRSLLNLTVPIFVLPLASLISTTPQALSFIFSIVTILILRPYFFDNSSSFDLKKIIAPGIFSLAALTLHPLSGLLLILFISLVISANLPKKISLALSSLLLAAFSLILPAAFAIQGLVSNLAPQITWPNINKLSELPLNIFLTTKFNAWGDIAYFISQNILLILIISSIFIFFKYTDRSLKSSVPLLSAAACFINFLVLILCFDFNYLIDYERADFALRSLTMAQLFLLPYLTLWPASSTNKTSTFPFYTPLLLSLILVTSVYTAYPRHDNYARSAAFNISAADQEAVRIIEELAAGQDYAALANQATSAAAIQSLGFKKYFKDTIFFYPVPTSGPLYALFLQMNERPSIDVIKQVGDLTETKLVFYVVHDYWWQAKNIKENTRPLATKTIELNNGETTIFIFQIP